MLLGEICNPIKKSLSNLIGIRPELGESFIASIKTFAQETALTINKVHATLATLRRWLQSEFKIKVNGMPNCF